MVDTTAFRDYLIKNNKNPSMATKEDALAYQKSLQPAPVKQELPQQDIQKLQQTVDVAGGREQFQQELKDRGLEDKFIDKFGPQKTQEPAPQQIKQEPVKQEVPKSTNTVKQDKTETSTLPQDIAEWKKQGSDMNTLEAMIEQKYGTIATQTADGGIQATIGDKSYKWMPDEAGNPIKQEIPADKISYDPNVLFEQIQSGQMISPEIKKTVEYKQANDRKKRLDTFTNMSASDLSIAIQDLSFLPGTQVYDDLKRLNPTLVADAEALNNINSINQPKEDIANIEEKLTKHIIDLLTGEDKLTYEQRISQNTELQSINEELTKSVLTLNDYKDQLEYVDEDIDKDLGRSVTKGYKNYLRGERTRELTRAYNLELAKYQVLAGQKQSISEDIKYSMDVERQEIADMEKALGLYQNMTADERALDLQKKQLELQNLYTYGDLNSDDPTVQQTAIRNAVNSLYQAYPIPGLQAPETKIRAINDMIAQGYTPQEALKKIEDDIRNSPGYKNMVSGGESQYGFTNVGDGVIAVTNPKTGEVSFKGKDTQGQEVEMSGLNNLAQSENIQCGKAVNTYIQDITGTYGTMGDTLDSKINTISSIGTSETPQVGGVFVSNPLNNTVGHTGVIVETRPDGSIMTLEANIKGTKEGGPLEYREYTADELKGMTFSQSLQGQEAKPDDSGYNKAKEGLYEMFASGKLSPTLMDQYSQDDKFLAEVNKYTKEATKDDPLFQQKIEQLQLLNDLVTWTNPTGDGLSGGIDNRRNESIIESMSGRLRGDPLSFFTGRAGFTKAKLQYVLDSEVLKNLIDVKGAGATFGALTEKELNMLQKAASVLNSARRNDKDGNLEYFAISEDDLKKNLFELKNNLATYIENKTGEAVKNTEYDNYFQNAGNNEADTLFNKNF